MYTMKSAHFSPVLRSRFADVQPDIQRRLDDFGAVPPSEYFYELCFCLCTPQSKAKSAHEVVLRLQEYGFRETPFDPVDILRSPEHYIRFHNTKARRLLAVREQFAEIEAVLFSERTPEQKRRWLVQNVNGIGMKEAAHFLRNIGYRELGILDRHILKHLTACGVFAHVPNVGSLRQYVEAETAFRSFAALVGIPMDELDLFFWYLEAGEIFK